MMSETYPVNEQLAAWSRWLSMLMTMVKQYAEVCKQYQWCVKLLPHSLLQCIVCVKFIFFVGIRDIAILHCLYPSIILSTRAFWMLSAIHVSLHSKIDRLPGRSLVKEHHCRNALDQSRHLQERSQSFSNSLIQDRSRKRVKWLP